MEEKSNVQYATFSSRTLALAIDFTILTFLLMPFISITNAWLYGGINFEQFVTPGTNKIDMSEAMTYLSEQYFFAKYFTMQFITLTIVLATFCTLWVKLKTTPGKWLVSCKIVDAETLETPSKSQFIKRALGYIISALPLGFGYFMMAWGERSQCLHDKIAGTVVLKTPHDFSWIKKVKSYITHRINKKSV